MSTTTSCIPNLPAPRPTTLARGAPATPRIAVVQHGDMLEAQRLVDGGQPEPYFGMGRSVAALRGLLHGAPHLVVSLDAPAYRVHQDEGTLVGLPLPAMPAWVPGTLPLLGRARAIRGLLTQFRPTHVLLRTAGLLGLLLTDWCVRRRLSTLVILADFLRPHSRRQRWEVQRFIRRLNDPCVFAVGNHRMPATQSLMDHGLRPDKAIAYDFACARHPRDYAEKSLPTAPPYRLVYAGNMLAGKGVADLLAALALLAQRRVPVTATLVGSGPELDAFRAQADALPAGVVTFPGRLGNDQVFALMRQAALVCVPSRHDYPEGLPQTLTEALASRTPVIVSDHPVMVRAFRDGEGLRCFPQANVPALADTITAMLADPREYQRLSHTTTNAYARVECRMLMPDLLARWRETFHS